MYIHSVQYVPHWDPCVYMVSGAFPNAGPKARRLRCAGQGQQAKWLELQKLAELQPGFVERLGFWPILGSSVTPGRKGMYFWGNIIEAQKPKKRKCMPQNSLVYPKKGA